MKNLKIKSDLKKLPWRLYFSVLLTSLLPTIYLTARVYFLGNIPSDWGVNIASQLIWINLVLEVIQEGLILPLFYIIGKTSKDRTVTINKVKTGLLITILVHIAILAVVGIFARFFVGIMAQDSSLTNATVDYIRLELVGLLLQSIYKFLFTVFIIFNQRKSIYLFLLIQMLSSIIFDALFLSDLSFSINIGVNGIAITNGITYSLLVVIMLYVAIKTFKISKKEVSNKLNFNWFREWLKVGGYSAADSFIRNLFYLIFVIRMMNVLAEQGTYWIANGFIWNWLLLAMYPLADVVKQSIATTVPTKLKGLLKPYYIVCTGIIILWFLTMPGWRWFIATVLNVENVSEVLSLVYLLLPAYISFVYNTVADALFYAIGRTESLAIQTIITNVVVYLTAYILFLNGIFVPTLESIAILFSIGIVVDGVITFALLWVYIKKYEKL